MFQTPYNKHSNDFGHWSCDELSSKRHCPDNATGPELHKKFLDATSSTYLGNKRTHYSPASAGAGRTLYKKSSAYDQENISMRGQPTLEDNTTVNRWDFRYRPATQLADEYSGCSTTHPSYQSCYWAGCGHYKEPFVFADGWATGIGNNVSSIGLTSVHDGNRNSVDQFPSSEAENPSTNLGYSEETRYLENSSVNERADLYRPRFASKPHKPGGSYEQGYLNNHADIDVDFTRERSANAIVTDTRVYHTVANFSSKSACESAATGAFDEATANSHSSSPIIGQGDGSHGVHARKSNYAYRSTSILPSGQNVSAVVGGMGCKEKKSYSGDCLTSVTTIPIIHAQGQSNAAPCTPEMTSATFQGENTVAPASGMTMYQEFKPNFCFLNNQATNHVTSDGLSSSTSSHPNFISAIGLVANTFSLNANTASRCAYTREELASTKSNDSVATPAGSDDVTSSINMFAPIISKEFSSVKVNDGNGSHIPDISESAGTSVQGEPPTAGSSVNGSVSVMHQNSTVAGQVDALTGNLGRSSSIANNDEIAAESGRADEHIESKGQIGPQAYPSAYEGILKSLISNAVDAANRSKRKLKWPLPIPLFVKPHETQLTFNDIDYSWVTHDIQVTVQGGLYAHTIGPRGLLQVFVDSPRAANSLLHLSCLAGLPVKISVGHNYTDKIGYIRGVPRRYSDSVLFEFLEDEGLLCAKRQIGYVKSDKRYPKGMTTGTVVLFFMPDRTLPTIVTIDNISYEVTRRIEQPLQCYNCQRFGHGSLSCAGSTRCRFCGGPHNFTQCKRRSKPKCVNCNQDHASTYWRCPVRMAYASADPRN